ncbi:MAG: 30S ribosomal protein S2 [Kiritimatiellae bacterium]|nr:30S ribosomal protein S2 [Kiritimatiellia bacterium]
MSEKNEPFVSLSATDLLNAGVHFGHQSKRWNPKMKRFIFEKRSGIYVIDLHKSLAQLELAAQFLYKTAGGGKNILFVGTKRQCQEIIKDAATRSGQFYVISRWLGGTLTNYQNIANSIRHMKEIQNMREKGTLDAMPQKEASRLRHELERLERNLMGIAGLTDLPGLPGAMVVVDINREAIAVREANRVGIPVVAMVDTNCNPDPINYPIPANDDSTRSIKLIINVLADAIVKAGAEYALARAQAQQAAETKEGEKTGNKPAARPPRGKKTHRGAAAKSGRPEEKEPDVSPAEKTEKAEESETKVTPEPQPQS